MPVDCGSITASRPAAATAASAAVPPARITSSATSAAAGCEVATIAFWAWTVERPAKWKFLIGKTFFVFNNPQDVQMWALSGLGGTAIRPGGGWYARDLRGPAARKMQGKQVDFAGFP